MSRSYRKLYATCGYGSRCHIRKFYKRMANKKIRKFSAPISDGRDYAKMTGLTWDICDYKIWCGNNSKYKRK